MIQILIVCTFLWSGANYACTGCLDGLASARGVAIVAVVYGATQAVSNFMWSFRWSKHTGCSEETSAIIQELGGISSAVENIALGVTIPLMVYLHQKNPENTDQV